MTESVKGVLTQWPWIALLRVVLRPFARLCIENGVVLNDFVSAAKGAFVDVAFDTLKRSNAKPAISRVSIMTGVHRSDVLALRAGSENDDIESASLLARVIGYWSTHLDYHAEEGGPRALTFRGPNSEFYQLCGKVSRAANPAAIVKELERTGRTVIEDNKLVLIKAVRQIGSDPVKAFQVFSQDLDAMVRTICGNLEQDIPTRNMHFSTEYDDIYVSSVPKIRDWLVEKGREFHREMRALLSAHDCELNPDLDNGSPSRVRVRVVSLSYIDLPSNDSITN